MKKDWRINKTKVEFVGKRLKNRRVSISKNKVKSKNGEMCIAVNLKTLIEDDKPLFIHERIRNKITSTTLILSDEALECLLSLIAKKFGLMKTVNILVREFEGLKVPGVSNTDSNQKEK